MESCKNTNKGKKRKRRIRLGKYFGVGIVALRESVEDIEEQTNNPAGCAHRDLKRCCLVSSDLWAVFPSPILSTRALPFGRLTGAYLIH